MEAVLCKRNACGSVLESSVYSRCYPGSQQKFDAVCGAAGVLRRAAALCV